jgi:flagellar motor switch protein FliN
MAPTGDDFDGFGSGAPIAQAAASATGNDRKAIEETEVELRVVLGTATLRVRDILKLGRGAVVELDRSIRSAADVYVAGYFIGRGEVTVIEDRMGVTLSDIFKSERNRR